MVDGRGQEVLALGQSRRDWENLWHVIEDKALPFKVI